MCCVVENGSNRHHLATVMLIDRTQSKGTTRCHIVVRRTVKGPRDGTLCRETVRRHLMQTDYATTCRAEVLRGDMWCRGTAWRHVDRSTCWRLRTTSGRRSAPLTPVLCTRHRRTDTEYAEYWGVSITPSTDFIASLFPGILVMLIGCHFHFGIVANTFLALNIAKP